MTSPTLLAAVGEVGDDFPWNCLNLVRLQDTNGAPLCELSGYNLFLMNVYGGFAGCPDPRQLPVGEVELGLGHLREAVRAGNDAWADAVAQPIRRGQADGSIPRAIDAHAAAVRLTAVVDGLSTRWLAGLLSTDEAHALVRGAVAAELGPAAALDASGQHGGA